MSPIPELRDHQKAQKFWTKYRHGLLHLATFNQEKAGTTGLTLDKPKRLTVEDDDFWINAPEFSKYVVEQILNDFSIYISDRAPPLPTVAEHDSMIGTSLITGTAATGPWHGSHASDGKKRDSEPPGRLDCQLS
jgi:hypothetical protein